jgi:hypothetical protein
MWKLVLFLFLLLPASAQSFFGLGVEDRHVFSTARPRLLVSGGEWGWITMGSGARGFTSGGAGW